MKFLSKLMDFIEVIMVIVILLGVFHFLFVPPKFNRSADIKLLTPAPRESVWAQPQDTSVFSWSTPLYAGEYEIVIASDPKFAPVLVHEPVVGSVYTP